MADRIEKDTQRFVRGVEQLISRKLPIYAGKTATQHFKDNFTKGGFVNGGLAKIIIPPPPSGTPPILRGEFVCTTQKLRP